jgi:sec-independent protein translocase protein TatC
MTENPMTFWEHIGELRKRLMISGSVLIIAGFASFAIAEPLAALVMQPVRDMKFVYLSPPELFMSYVKISFMAGLVFSSPIILLQIWLFIKPALKRHERGTILAALFFGMLFFAGGAAFAFLVVAPFTLNFFLQYASNQVGPLFSFGQYVDFVSTLVLSFGVVFEMPVIVAILATLGILRGSTIAKSRRYAILLIFIVAAILTPPDIVSQVIMALPMLLLFEFSINIARIIEKRRDKRLKAEEEAV